MAAGRKALIDLLLRRVLKGSSKENLGRIARGEGYKSIDEWASEGAPGLTSGLKSGEKRKTEEFRKLVAESDEPELKELYQEEILTPSRKRRERATKRRAKELGLDPVAAVKDLTPSERGELFNLQQASEETINLKQAGRAKANLDSFTERLTNDKLYKEYIKQGYVNPITWAEAGLPPFPKELTRPRSMARTRLGTYRDKRFDQLSDTAKRKVLEEEARIRNLQKSNLIPPTAAQFRSAQEEARAVVQAEIKRLQAPKYHRETVPETPSTKTFNLTDQQQKELAVLKKEQGQAGKLLPADTLRKVEGGAQFSERYEPTSELERSYGRLVGEDPTDMGTGVDIYGRPVSTELDWSEGHDTLFKHKLRKMGYNDESSLTPTESMTLRKEIADEIDAGSLHPSMDIYTRQTLSGSTNVRDQYGYNLEEIRNLKRNLDPVEDADELVELRAREQIIKAKLNKLDLPFEEEGIKIPTAGSPASASHQLMRGRGLSQVDEADPMITGMEPEFQTESLSIDQIADIQQRYGDPERVKRGIQSSISEPADITGEEAAFIAGQARRKQIPLDLEKGLKDPAENISYGAPSTREIAGEVGRLPSYDPKVVSSLRRRATNLRKKRDAFRDEAAQRVIEITDRAPTHPYTKLSAPQRADAIEARDLVWEELRGTPKFQKYMQDKAKLQTEINDKTPGLMEFDQYARPQRTITRPRRSAPEPYQLDLNLPPTIRQSNLEQAMKEGKVDLRDPAMAERWAKEAPQRKANQWTIDGYNAQIKKVRKTKGQYDVNKKLAKIQNDTADRFDAIDAGFTKKNKAGETVPDIAAWKKAGSPKPLDRTDRADIGISFITDPSGRTTRAGKMITPKRKLVDSFKKGRKIVNRKRGGIIKKPRGWGAARYAGK